jgi:hypothetical protein
LAVAIGYPKRNAARSIRHALGLVGWYCIKHGAPTLNSLVVNQQTKEAGESVVLQNGLSPFQERTNVVNFGWELIPSPTASALRAIASEHRSAVAKVSEGYNVGLAMIEAWEKRKCKL